MPTIKRGENVVHTETMFLSDGTTPLDIATLATCAVQIRQYNHLMATYTLLPAADPEIRISDVNKLVVEIPVSLSETFKEGPVTMKILMTKSEAPFLNEAWRDIDEEEIFRVEA